MESPCRVNDHHVGSTSFTRLHRIEGNRRRIATWLMCYYHYTQPLGPGVELLYGGSAESICCTQDHPIPGFLKETGELGDAGGEIAAG